MLDVVFYFPRPDRLYRRIRARLSRPDIDPVTVRQILTAYDLDVIGSPQVPGGSGRSHSLIVTTNQGKKVLKRYKSTIDYPTIVHEHSILSHLAQTGFPAPRQLTTRIGETVVSKEGGNYALFDFIEGGRQYHNYVLLPFQVRHFITLAGETLAALHHELENFVPEGRNPNGFKSRTGDWWRDIAWYTGTLAFCVEETQCMEAGEGGAQSGWLLQQASRLECRLHQLCRTLEEAALPRLIIHSDYGPYNLLFGRDALVAVLDFEIARLDWRISEFVYAFPRFAQSRFGFSFEKMRCFLAAYRARMPMSNDELRFIPAAWQYSKLRRAIVCWQRYCESHAGRWLIEVRQNLDAADWMADNQDGFLKRLITT